MTEVLSTSACKVHSIVHIVVICDPTVKMVTHTASMRSAITWNAAWKVPLLVVLSHQTLQQFSSEG